MMKKILIILTIYLLVPYLLRSQDIRTQFFPKTELKAENIPDKENLWVFILAGQSNMAGRGLVEPQDTIPSERILTINKNGEIIVAKEPLHFNEPSMAGLDCGLSFGKSMIRQLPDSISILLIPVAVGGSSISQWTGDSIFRKVQLLTNFREKVMLGQRYGLIKGILWHQGENDANQIDIPLYKNRLTALFGKFREISGNKNLPILIGELGSYSENNENWKKINEQIRLYSSTDNNTIIISTTDLKEKGDKVHFNSEGQRMMGQRFADGYISKILSNPDDNK
ncbi:MAG: sialate O-acetylesterase [Bacteroidales bacterium]|nr:sialate O-acetylesterase [Bacteroidales bacterium]